MQHVVEKVGTYIIYGLVGVYAAVERCCARRQVVYETMTWQAINLDTGVSEYAEEFHELDRVGADVVLHHIRKTHGLHQSHKTVLQWTNEAGQGYSLPDVFEQAVAPWLFVGYIGDDGRAVDCTETLDHIVVLGNRVTIPILRSVVDCPAEKWVYINPKTFDQVEFPSEGILIGDVVPSPAATSSTKDD
uniref:Uncharacterized protein n=1 Tax=viral metagenome TaxID=1070528 RepID=A0A6C0B5C3_9ZZZZ